MIHKKNIMKQNVCDSSYSKVWLVLNIYRQFCFALSQTPMKNTFFGNGAPPSPEQKKISQVSVSTFIVRYVCDWASALYAAIIIYNFIKLPLGTNYDR